MHSAGEWPASFPKTRIRPVFGQLPPVTPFGGVPFDIDGLTHDKAPRGFVETANCGQKLRNSTDIKYNSRVLYSYGIS